MNPRLLATRILGQVIDQGKSLNACVDQLSQINDPKDRAFSREIVSGVLRHHARLVFILNQLLAKPLKKKDGDISILLLVGLYQLYFMRTPDHAAVSETVKLTKKLKKDWAKSLVNGVLRQSIRERSALEAKVEENLSAKYSHPDWIVRQLRKDWPEDYISILGENQKQAPMTLRVNLQKSTIAEYQALLRSVDLEVELTAKSSAALKLKKPCDVAQLPKFKMGYVSVQDLAAQQAAPLLKLEPGMLVLDACAAPGGKTAAMLELNPDMEVLALDISAQRLDRVKETLERLDLKAMLKSSAAEDHENWWDGRCFDRILLDAPCSAIGVIRRNPDIKIHRKPEDIPHLVEKQRKILASLWPMLKPGGLLVYATCSVLKAENEYQVANFLESNQDAREVKIVHNWGNDVTVGKQIFPGQDDMDGFYYACIEKV